MSDERQNDGAAEGTEETRPSRLPGRTVEPPIPIETELARRLVLGERLGEGGLAVVTEVTEKNLQSKLALKALHDNTRYDSSSRDLLIREARITAHLDHQGIVPVHEIGIDRKGAILPPGSLYFTMKLVEGDTLADILTRTDPGERTGSQLFELLQVFMKVCDAVAYAHDKGIIHRDIKPANIMIGVFKEVYLMDWGVATKVGSPVDQRLVGTLNYMSPEQARADSVPDKRTDIYSLGAVLYSILTGRAPLDPQGSSFENRRFKAILCEHQHPIDAVPWDLPQELCDITSKALSKDPGIRQQSATELREEVEAFMRSVWHLPRVRYRAGDTIVEENTPGRSAFVIVEGQCMAFRIIDGVRVNLREMGPGDVFGETAIFTGQPRTASVEATGDVVLIKITDEYFTQNEGLGHWMGKFVMALAQRFAERDARATELEMKLAGDN